MLPNPEPTKTFRDFGILPEGLKPPSDKIRCFYSMSRLAGQYFATALVSAVGIVVTLLVVVKFPLPLNLLGGVSVLCGFGVFVWYVTRNDYRWVELEGTTIRAKHMYTGRITEFSVANIDCLLTRLYSVRRLETIITEKLLGRVRGIEVRFRDRSSPLHVTRSDPAMTNAEEFIQGILFRMEQIRSVDAEIIQFGGKLAVRQIYWKGELSSPARKNDTALVAGCLIGLALLFGILTGFMGLEEQNLRRLGIVPPHEITLSSLIKNGPGPNRHVTITDFRAGGYLAESRGGPWTSVTIALFPLQDNNRAVEPGEAPKQIQAVLSSNAVANEVELGQMLRNGRVTGICSESQRTSWGATAGPKLVEFNPGYQLRSAWWIDELREPPSEARINGIYAGSAALYALVLILIAILPRLSR